MEYQNIANLLGNTLNQPANITLTWSSTCVIFSATGETKFKIIDAKLYVPVVTLSTQDNAKLLQQLKSGFKRTINCNKYQWNPKTYAQNRYLNHSVDPSFQGLNRPFVLSFKNEDDRTSHPIYYLLKVEIKDYNVTIDDKNFFDQPANSELKTYEKIGIIATDQGDDCTTGCLLSYTYIKDYYKKIAIDLSKQKVLDADPRAIQQINFTANLDRAGNLAMLFIVEEAKETVLDFSQGTVKVLWMCYRIQFHLIV